MVTNCDARCETILKNNPGVGDAVNILVNWTTSTKPHEKIQKILRCCGPDREKIALKVSAKGVSKIKIEHELDNIKNSFDKNCK